MVTTAVVPHNDVGRRQDFVLIFDVQDGNPNGDPDANNQPRVDPETMHGLVTDVCLKRKIRDYVDFVRGDELAYKIYVQKGESLNDKHQRAYDALGIQSTGTKQKNREDIDRTRDWMCQNFYDIRLFGAVMSTKVNCGQVKGPVWVSFARSIDPIMPQDVTITRVAVTRTEDMDVQSEEDGNARGGKQIEMGRKPLIHYGVYKASGSFNPNLAQRTGVVSDDLELLWQALINMWDVDRSTSRGLMACRGLYVFTHHNAYGNAPSHQLYDRVVVERKSQDKTPRSFDDYITKVNKENLPVGMHIAELV